MNKITKLFMTLGISAIILATSGCSYRNDISMNKNGEGVFSTIVEIEEKTLNTLVEEGSEDSVSMEDEELNIAEVFARHKVDGIELDVEEKEVAGKLSLKVSFAYDNVEDFNQSIKKLIDYNAGLIGYMEGEEELSAATKGVIVYEEEETFEEAVYRYLVSKGIKVDRESNKFRKFMKLFKSSIKVDIEEIAEEEMEFNEFLDETIDEEVLDEEVLDEEGFDDEWLNEEFSEDYYEDEELLDPAEAGHVIIRNTSKMSELKLHIEALEVISEYIDVVLSDEFGNMLAKLMTGPEIDEERVALYISALEQMDLATEIKNSFKVIETEDSSIVADIYVIEDMTPGQMIDIFTEQYMERINSVIDEVFVEEIESEYDELSEDVFDAFTNSVYTYSIAFENALLEFNFDDEDVYEYIDDSGYVTIVSKKGHNSLSISNNFIEIDKTPDTADKYALAIIGIIVVIAAVGVVVFARISKQR